MIDNELGSNVNTQGPSLFNNEIPYEVRKVIGDQYPVPISEDLIGEQSSEVNFNQNLFNEVESIVNKLRNWSTRCKKVLADEIISHENDFICILDSIKNTDQAFGKEIFNKVFPFMHFLKRVQDQIMSFQHLSLWDKQILDIFIRLRNILSELKN